MSDEKNNTTKRTNERYIARYAGYEGLFHGTNPFLSHDSWKNYIGIDIAQAAYQKPSNEYKGN